MDSFGLAGVIFALLGFFIFLLLLVVAIRLQAIITILRKMQKIKIKFLEESQNN